MLVKIYRKYEVIVSITAGLLAAAAFLAPHFVHAILSTAPPRTIQTGDISTTEILDDTIVDADISSTTAISISKLGTLGNQGLVPFSNGDRIATSTDFSFSTTTRALTVQDLNVPGGTTTLRGVAYTWPVADGAANEILTTDGAGSLSWGSASDWKLLVSTTTANNMKVASTTFAAHDQLRIVFTAPSTGSQNMFMRFNQDSGNSYGFKKFRDYALIDTQSNVTSVQLDEAGTTSPRFIDVTVQNLATERKHFWWQMTSSNSGTNAPVHSSGSGVWSNAVDQITSFEIQIDGAGTEITAGATLSIWGKKN